MADLSGRRKPPILLLGTQMAVGGAQQLLLDQADRFHQLGYPVTAVFLYDRDGLHQTWQAGRSYPLLNLHAFSKGAGSISNLFQLIGGMIRLWSLLLHGKFQAIETFTHHSNLIGCPLAWLAGVPIRVASHHGLIDRMPSILTRLHTWMINLGLVNTLVAVSKDIISQSIREGVHAKRLVLIPNGVKFIPADPQEAMALRNELVSSPSGNLILSVGRLTYQKGHTFLLQALPSILEQYPDTYLALAGDGPLRDDLMAEGNNLGIADKIHFLGVRSDVPDLLAAADLFVLSSRWEGLSLVLLEAMSARRAIIATQAEGVSEALQDGQCGVLIPIENSQALAESIQSLLADPERRRTLADNAYQRYLQEYTQDKMIARYLALLDPNTHPMETNHAVDQE